MKQDPLFEPITINKTKIKNRIYMPAMHLGMADNFHVTEQILAFYGERAKGGAGLICTGFATIDELSGNTLNIGVHKDEFLPGLKNLADSIKENGAKSAVQLNHAGRYNFSFFLDGRQPVAPSAVASRLTKETPRALEKDEITQIIQSFARAASRVKDAGFDAVEVLHGTGYLISEFLSPLTNKREDEYGGTLDNRIRFGTEVTAAVRKAVGPDYPLIVRMNGNDFMQDGQSREELKEYARILVELAGADAICVNAGWHEARVPQITTAVPRGAFAYLSRIIKDAVEVPVIASHRINDPHTAREMIADGLCDMAAMGRSLIADPHLPEKAAQGRENEIIHCVACAQGCFDHLFQLKPVECLCNPLAGHEHETSFSRTKQPKKVMVIGGGPAGMNAAIAAADKGHHVTLYEKTGRLGGQLYLAAAPPGREEFAQLARDLEQQLICRGIEFHLNQAVDRHLLERKKPEHVVLSSGAKPLIPEIPGVEMSHVVQSWDVLAGKVYTGKRVAVLGGGAAGVETALFLAQKGTISGETLKFLLLNRAETPEALYELAAKGTREVMLIEMLEKIGQDFGKTTRWGMLQDVSRFGIKTFTAARALKITENGVLIERKNNGGETEEINADTVVLCAGSAPDNDLETVLKEKSIPYTPAGDTEKIGRAFDAVHRGYDAGRSI